MVVGRCQDYAFITCCHIVIDIARVKVIQFKFVLVCSVTAFHVDNLGDMPKDGSRMEERG